MINRYMVFPKSILQWLGSYSLIMILVTICSDSRFCENCLQKKDICLTEWSISIIKIFEYLKK